jgi:hypothetical protein
MKAALSRREKLLHTAMKVTELNYSYIFKEYNFLAMLICLPTYFQTLYDRIKCTQTTDWQKQDFLDV